MISLPPETSPPASGGSLRPAPARVWREVLTLWGAGLAVLLGSDLLGGLGGFIGRNQGALTAAYFLLAPVVLLRRRGTDPADLGISTDRPVRALVAALAVAAAVFPPYVAAYEGWARLTRGAAMALPEHPLTHFPAELRDRPPLPGVPGVHAWVESERLWVVNTGAGAATLRAEGCACPARGADLKDDGLFHASRPVACSPDGAGPIRLAAGQGLSCPAGAAERVAVRTSDPEVRVLAGAASVETDPGGGAFDRSWWWIPELLLIQLVVIALPEEVFYRGYVQSRLRPLFATRRRLRLLGAEIGWEVPLASALFAASHLVTIPSPFRLAVFFPGLLFGWMRERTGSVLAPAVFHAMCNVLLEMLVRWHG